MPGSATERDLHTLLQRLKRQAKQDEYYSFSIYIESKQTTFGTEFPLLIQEKTKMNPTLISDIEKISIGGDYEEQLSLFKIKSTSLLRDLLIKDIELTEVTSSHPMASSLKKFIYCNSTGKLPINEWNWYATPEFDTQNQPRNDQFLIADDPQANESFFLHVRHFDG